MRKCFFFVSVYAKMFRVMCAPKCKPIHQCIFMYMYTFIVVNMRIIRWYKVEIVAIMIIFIWFASIVVCLYWMLSTFFTQSNGPEANTYCHGWVVFDQLFFNHIFFRLFLCSDKQNQKRVFRIHFVYLIFKLIFWSNIWQAHNMHNTPYCTQSIVLMDAVCVIITKKRETPISNQPKLQYTIT